MIIEIFDFITNFVIYAINTTGYIGLFLFMIADSCGVPVPSSVVMPFAGFLVAMGKLNFWVVAVVGTFANLVGYSFIYFISLKGGRPLLEKYGKYLLVSKDDLDKADKWFAKYGEVAVFISRLFPVVRTAISFPAGVAKMNFKKFLFFSFWGALGWNIAITFLGVKLQHNWESIRGLVEGFGTVVAVLVLSAVGIYIWRHIKRGAE